MDPETTCPHCDRSFKSFQALSAHQRHCIPSPRDSVPQRKRVRSDSVPDEEPMGSVYEPAQLAAVVQPELASDYAQVIADQFDGKFNPVPDWSQFSSRITGCGTNPAGTDPFILNVSHLLTVHHRLLCQSGDVSWKLLRVCLRYGLHREPSYVSHWRKQHEGLVS